MTHTRTSMYWRIGLALAFALLLGAAAGCTTPKTSSTTTTPPSNVSSAKAAYALATSALSTVAPDGKLLLVQTGEAVTATSNPTWQFLIGSPKTDKIYVVGVTNGKARPAEYGSAGLKAAEWSQVPSATAWQIDSPEAHTKAVAVYPNGKDAAYFMGFLTYVPKSANSKTKTMQWVISFDPASKGSAPTSTVMVDVTTGEAAYAK